MRPDEHQDAIIRRKCMAGAAITFALRFARFKAAKVKSLGERGTALVEFALLAPVLLLILLGTAQFGLTLGQYVTMTNAVGVGAMQFAVSRSDTQPYTDAVNSVKAAATILTPASLTITLTVNGTVCGPMPTCAGNAACATALTSNVGQPAQVSATYPCNLLIMWYKFCANLQPDIPSYGARAMNRRARVSFRRWSGTKAAPLSSWWRLRYLLSSGSARSRSTSAICSPPSAPSRPRPMRRRSQERGTSVSVGRRRNRRPLTALWPGT